jgi:hypothetical protein
MKRNSCESCALVHEVLAVVTDVVFTEYDSELEVVFEETRRCVVWDPSAVTLSWPEARNDACEA